MRGRCGHWRTAADTWRSVRAGGGWSGSTRSGAVSAASTLCRFALWAPMADAGKAVPSSRRGSGHFVSCRGCESSPARRRCAYCVGIGRPCRERSGDEWPERSPKRSRCRAPTRARGVSGMAGLFHGLLQRSEPLQDSKRRRLRDEQEVQVDGHYGRVAASFCVVAGGTGELEVL